MKNKLQLLGFIAIALIIGLMFTSCNSLNNNESIKGRWIKDGTEAGVENTITIDENTIYCGFSSTEGGMSFSLDIVSYSGNKVTVEDGDENVEFNMSVNSARKLIISGSSGIGIDGTYTKESTDTYDNGER